MPNNARIRFLAGASALLMLAVVAASAYIRASGGIDVQIARGVHRVTASSVALLVLVLMALAWGQPRLRVAASAAFALMLALSAVGWITGTTPPLAAAFFNQSGGLALTALLAWIYGRAAAPAAADRNLALAALSLAGLQAVFGGVLAIFAPQASVGVLILHAAAGLAAAATAAALGWRYAACAALAPALGVVSVVLPAFAAQAGHALAGALLLAAAAYAHALALVTPHARASA